MSKPSVKLIGQDGNVFAIIARCREAAREHNMPKETLAEFMAEVTSGDYNHALQTVMKYFNVEGEESEDNCDYCGYGDCLGECENYCEYCDGEDCFGECEDEGEDW